MVLTSITNVTKLAQTMDSKISKVVAQRTSRVSMELAPPKNATAFREDGYSPSAVPVAVRALRRQVCCRKAFRALAAVLSVVPALVTRARRNARLFLPFRPWLQFYSHDTGSASLQFFRRESPQCLVTLLCLRPSHFFVLGYHRFLDHFSRLGIDRESDLPIFAIFQFHL